MLYHTILYYYLYHLSIIQILHLHHSIFSIILSSNYLHHIYHYPIIQILISITLSSNYSIPTITLPDSLLSPSSNPLSPPITHLSPPIPDAPLYSILNTQNKYSIRALHLQHSIPPSSSQFTPPFFLLFPLSHPTILPLHSAYL
jgi:hypothetical protein